MAERVFVGLSITLGRGGAENGTRLPARVSREVEEARQVCKVSAARSKDVTRDSYTKEEPGRIFR